MILLSKLCGCVFYFLIVIVSCDVLDTFLSFHGRPPWIVSMYYAVLSIILRLRPVIINNSTKVWYEQV